MRTKLQALGLTTHDTLQDAAFATGQSVEALGEQLGLRGAAARLTSRALGVSVRVADTVERAGTENAAREAQAVRGRREHPSGPAAGHILRARLEATLGPPAEDEALGELPRVVALPGDVFVSRDLMTAGRQAPLGAPPTLEDLELENARAMYRAMKARGRPQESSSHLRMLAQLGIGWNGDEPVIPTLATLSRRLRSYFDALGVPEHDRIMPALPYALPDGTYGHIFVGEPLPARAKLVSRFLPHPVYDAMLAAGALALGGVDMTEGAVVPLTYFEHDLAHVTGYMEYPDLMAAVRRAMSMPPTGLTELRYDAIESMAYVPAKVRPQLMGLLDLPSTPGRGPTRDDIVLHLEKRTPGEREALAQRLLVSALPLVMDLGGAARDNVNTSHHSIPRSHLKKALAEPGAENLAEVQLALHILADLEPEAWMAAVEAGVPAGSPLHSLMTDAMPTWPNGKAYERGDEVQASLPRGLRYDAAFRRLPYDYRPATATPLGAEEVDALLQVPWVRKNLHEFVILAATSTEARFAITPSGATRLLQAAAESGNERTQMLLLQSRWNTGEAWVAEALAVFARARREKV